MSIIQQQLINTSSIFANAPYPASCTRVSVIVPVQNEAAYLLQTLDALRLQLDVEDLPLSPDLYEVLVLVNNSTDQSYAIAVNYAKAHPSFRLWVDNITLPPTQANIGTVRGLLMNEAANRLKATQNCDAIIASTDGDTFVDNQWIALIIKEIDNGADAVGGRILTKPGEGTARMYHLRNVTYRYLLTQAEFIIDPEEHDPWPRHFQYFGANMAVTCKMYEQAGRLPKVPYLEDMAFHQALLLIDARIRKSCDVKVYTSSRTDGRVEIGFSEQLKKWAAEDHARIPQRVESVKSTLQMFMIRNSLRNCWAEYHNLQLINHTQIADIALQIGVKSLWLQIQVVNTAYFGTLWHTVEQETKAEQVELQPIQDAIAQLRMFISNKEFTAFQTDLTGTFRAADAVNA